TTKFKSLELGVQAGSDGAWRYSNYTAANAPLPADNDPHSVFARVFTDLGVDAATIERLRAERKSVLDAVGESYQSLSPQLCHHIGCPSIHKTPPAPHPPPATASCASPRPVRRPATTFASPPSQPSSTSWPTTISRWWASCRWTFWRWRWRAI